jgi:formylglycine-generating enzyme required for sulfatase activity
MVLVRVPSGLWVGKYEVTQSEYQTVMGTNPSKSKNDRQPVEQVTWNDAMEFTRKLTELEKSNLPSGYRYSLPSASQWKDFLGGQKFEDLPGGGVTWKGRPSAVGESSPSNKFGLFDVLGNVWEWCLDGDGEEKILKGGAFNHATYESRLAPDKTMISCGFRCVLVAP